MQSIRRIGALALLVGVFITFLITPPVQSASMSKRSIASRDTANNHYETCRTDAVCGWEVYHRTNRESQYYVASLCKCSAEETCIRTGDDIATFSYVYRCRLVRRNKNRNRQQVTNGPNSTASASTS